MSEELNQTTVDINDVIEQPTQVLTEAPKKKHGKLGITSFILALLSGLVIVIGLVISTRAALSFGGDPNAIAANPESLPSDLLGPLMMAGVVMVFGAGLSFVGFILGIIGLFMKNTKKLFAILGTILNGLPIVLVLFLMIIGLTMQASM